MASSNQPEDLLSVSLSLSQPLPTDHYTPNSFGLDRLMANLESEPHLPSHLDRAGTPGTSGDDGKVGSGSGGGSGTTSTSNSSAVGLDSSGKKKSKKKKKKKQEGELMPESIPEDEDVVDFAHLEPVSPVRSSSKTELRSLLTPNMSQLRPSSPELRPIPTTRLGNAESVVEDMQKEAIIVGPWEMSHDAGLADDEQEGKMANHTESNTSGTDIPTLTAQRTFSETTPSSPRRAIPMHVRRPAPTLLDEFPALSNIPNLIPSGFGISALPLPSLHDVKAAGRATTKAGIALVGSVRDEYMARVKGQVEVPQGDKHKATSGRKHDRAHRGDDHHSGARHRRKNTHHRRHGSDLSSDSDSSEQDAASASGVTDNDLLEDEEKLEDDSGDEVLIDAEDAEGMAETWRGLTGQPSEAALGLGWMKWRSCKWEMVKAGNGDERRLLVTLNPSPQTALQIIDCSVADSAFSPFATPLNMLHPETVDLANSTVLQSSPYEVLHIPRHKPRPLRRMAGDANDAPPLNVFRCSALEVIDGSNVFADDLNISEDDEEILVDCAVWRSLESATIAAPTKWLFLTLLKHAEKPHWTYGQLPHESEDHSVFLSLFDSRSGKVERKMFLGKGRAGQVLSSPTCLIVSIAAEEPRIHFLSPTTLKPTLRPVTANIGLNSRTGLPVVSLSGRLFAYVSTDKRPRQPIQLGFQDPRLGTIVTAASNQTAYFRSQQAELLVNTSTAKPGSPQQVRIDPHSPVAESPSMQSIVLNTAAGLGSEMAKGVWTGLKGLSSAAMQGASKSETLSKSAPALSHFAQRYASSKHNNGSTLAQNGRNSIPAEDIQATSRLPQNQSRFSAGSWVKMLDLGSRQPEITESHSQKRTHVERSKDKKPRKAKVIAHFALPTSEVISVPHSAIGIPTIDALSFAPGGTALALGTTDGRSSFVVEIRPGELGIMNRPVPNDHSEGEVWVRYELRRGVTPAVVERIEWSACGGWIGIGTRRTIHIFAIHPSGGRVSAAQIKSSRLLNLDYLPPLSVKVSPLLRIRRPRGISRQPIKPSTPPSPANGNQSTDTLIPWKLSNCRIPARAFFFGPPVLAGLDNSRQKKEIGVLRTVNVFDPMKRILRSEAVYIARETQGSNRAQAEDNAEKPMTEELKLASSTFRAWKLPTEPYQFYVGGDISGTISIVRKSEAISFANAEIHTYSTSGKVLPRPIYRENWLGFSTIRPGYDGLPSQYQYRVTVDPSVPGQHDIVVDLNRPLDHAIQSHLDIQQSMPIIPALPNGAGREASRWHSPIGAFAHAKDIVRMRRKDSNLTSASATSGTPPASYGDHLAVETDTGFLFEEGEGGVNEPDEMTTGSTSGDTRDDDWDDDLVTGVMDDEMQHTAYPCANGKGNNR